MSSAFRPGLQDNGRRGTMQISRAQFVRLVPGSGILCLVSAPLADSVRGLGTRTRCFWRPLTSFTIASLSRSRQISGLFGETTKASNFPILCSDVRPRWDLFCTINQISFENITWWLASGLLNFSILESMVSSMTPFLSLLRLSAPCLSRAPSWLILLVCVAPTLEM